MYFFVLFFVCPKTCGKMQIQYYFFYDQNSKEISAGGISNFRGKLISFLSIPVQCVPRHPRLKWPSDFIWSHVNFSISSYLRTTWHKTFCSIITRDFNARRFQSSNTSIVTINIARSYNRSLYVLYDFLIYIISEIKIKTKHMSLV